MQWSVLCSPLLQNLTSHIYPLSIPAKPLLHTYTVCRYSCNTYSAAVVNSHGTVYLTQDMVHTFFLAQYSMTRRIQNMLRAAVHFLCYRKQRRQPGSTDFFCGVNAGNKIPLKISPFEGLLCYSLAVNRHPVFSLFLLAVGLN